MARSRRQNVSVPSGYVLTAPARAYLRWAPWRFGKRALWSRVAAPLARRPRRFVARTSHGFWIEGDQRLLMSRCIYWFGAWEPPLSAWIRGVLRPGDVFVDVGANFGYFSLLAARAVGPIGSVVAVEASATTVRRLERNLARNRFSNVRIVHAVAGANDGRVPFYRAPWNDAESTTVPTQKHEPEGDVPAAPLPRLLTVEELARVRVIKIDVEGGELGVVEGLLPAIGALRDDAELAIEVHPAALARQGASVAELLGLVARAGFHARELPVDFSEIGHLFAAHPDPAVLGAGDGVRHLILTRGAPRRASTK